MEPAHTRYICSQCRLEFDTKEECDEHCKLHESEVWFVRIDLTWDLHNWYWHVSKPFRASHANITPEPEINVTVHDEAGSNYEPDINWWCSACLESQVSSVKQRMLSMAAKWAAHVLESLQSIRES